MTLEKKILLAAAETHDDRAKKNLLAICIVESLK